ncbi:ATP-binding protein [Allorhizocola rhizosphaerae]|uniref:ATP-binding protein n=1 Tax=Allorhizocola rhizosphaerae TaxID=1872709 RepID=UPI0013C2E9F4|nr:ATP-binding protein [Allorhizocola rhizosphaerae]
MPMPDPEIFEVPFDAARLADLRAAVVSYAPRLGVPAQRVDAFVAAINEVTTNAVRYGTGAGRLRIWRTADHLCCQVVNRRRDFSTVPVIATRPPPPDSATGRGLWLAHHLWGKVTVEEQDEMIIVTLCGDLT